MTRTSTTWWIIAAAALTIWAVASGGTVLPIIAAVLVVTGTAVSVTAGRIRAGHASR